MIKTDDLNFSKKVTDKYLELCNTGKIDYCDELRIFKCIEDKYKPVTIPKYESMTGINHKTINERFDKGMLSGLMFGGKKFIYSLFN